MASNKHLLVGLVGFSPKDIGYCCRVVESCCDKLGFGFLRVDVLKPLWDAQKSVYLAFGVPEPEGLDPSITDPISNSFDLEFGKSLKFRVRTMLSLNEDCRIVIFTPDLRNKVDRTAKELGYRVIRLQRSGPRERDVHLEDNWVEADFEIPEKEFKKSPRRALERALAVIIKNKK